MEFILKLVVRLSRVMPAQADGRDELVHCGEFPREEIALPVRRWRRIARVPLAAPKGRRHQMPHLRFSENRSESVMAVGDAVEEHCHGKAIPPSVAGHLGKIDRLAQFHIPLVNGTQDAIFLSPSGCAPRQQTHVIADLTLVQGKAVLKIPT